MSHVASIRPKVCMSLENMQHGERCSNILLASVHNSLPTMAPTAHQQPAVACTGYSGYCQDESVCVLCDPCFGILWAARTLYLSRLQIHINMLIVYMCTYILLVCLILFQGIYTLLIGAVPHITPFKRLVNPHSTFHTGVIHSVQSIPFWLGKY